MITTTTPTTTYFLLLTLGQAMENTIAMEMKKIMKERKHVLRYVLLAIVFALCIHSYTTSDGELQDQMKLAAAAVLTYVANNPKTFLSALSSQIPVNGKTFERVKQK